MKKNNKEFRANNIHNTIVVLCNIFSPHLFVTGHIPPHILVKLRETFLFWIKTIAINNNEIIICVTLKTVIIFYFLENNIAYKIFKIVKIATAIIKFIHPFIWKTILGSDKTLFIVFSKSHKIQAFMSKLIIG